MVGAKIGMNAGSAWDERALPLCSRHFTRRGRHELPGLAPAQVLVGSWLWLRDHRPQDRPIGAEFVGEEGCVVPGIDKVDALLYIVHGDDQVV
jgi:hypothetical protein